MKVVALQMGYYGDKRVREGEEFVLESEKHFSHNWMEPVDGPAPAGAKPAYDKDAVPGEAGEKKEEKSAAAPAAAAAKPVKAKAPAKPKK
jgi:hypothetical protein